LASIGVSDAVDSGGIEMPGKSWRSSSRQKVLGLDLVKTGCPSSVFGKVHKVSPIGTEEDAGGSLYVLPVGQVGDDRWRSAEIDHKVGQREFVSVRLHTKNVCTSSGCISLNKKMVDLICKRVGFGRANPRIAIALANCVVGQHHIIVDDGPGTDPGSRSVHYDVGADCPCPDGHKLRISTFWHR